MNAAQRFAMLGQQQLTLAEGIEMLEQIQRDLGRDMGTASGWGAVAMIAQTCQVPLNIIVNGMQLGGAKLAFDAFAAGLRAYVVGDALRRRQWGEAGLAVAFEAAKQAIEAGLKKKGAAQFVPGANILLGLAEDGWSLLQAAQTVSEGSAEMRLLARQMQQRIDATRRRWTALGIERAQLLDTLQLQARTA